MHHQQLSPTERHDSRARAKVIYETIADKLALNRKGKIVAIEVESGEYFVGETVLDAAGKARVKPPGRPYVSRLHAMENVGANLAKLPAAGVNPHG